MFNPLLFLYCLVIPEQLLGSPLVGSEADHFSDEVPHELVVFGQFAFGLAGLGLQVILQRDMGLVPV